MRRRRKQPRAAVKLPKGVHKVTSRGHEYYYFQAGRGTAAQGPRIQLPNDYESPEFWAALRGAQGKSSAPIVNTVNLVADEYLAAASPSLSASSLDHYQRALGIAKKAWGDLAIEGVRPAHVKKLMDGMATTPAKANQFLSVMKIFSGWSLVSDIQDHRRPQAVERCADRNRAVEILRRSAKGFRPVPLCRPTRAGCGPARLELCGRWRLQSWAEKDRSRSLVPDR
jgi:hypothetical protein